MVERVMGGKEERGCKGGRWGMEKEKSVDNKHLQ